MWTAPPSRGERPIRQLNEAALDETEPTEHPWRRAVLAEMHLRPFLAYPTPHRFHHFAFLVTPKEARREAERIIALCDEHGIEPPASGARFHTVSFDSWTLRWEQHSEFSSYSWATQRNADEPFAISSEAVRREFADMMPPGQLLVSLSLALVPYKEGTNPPEELFDRASLTAIEAAGGLARASTDFRPDDTGSVRILVEDFGLSPTRAGRLVQRLIELETYRCLALLGLPAARAADPVVRKIEDALHEASLEMAKTHDHHASQALLERLTMLSAELETSIATTSFRFGATRAYSEIVRARLQVVREQEYSGYISFSRFLRRRFNPAIATCTAMQARQTAVSERIAHAVDLLRTRIQLDVEQQNRELLSSMNRRSEMQLRLQQTVEGLSVAAVSYYVVGLVGYAVKGFKESGWLPKSLSAELLVGLSVPLVIALVWSTLILARNSWTHGNDEKK